MGRRPKPEATFDRELLDMPEPLRRREFMMRVEAVIFASARPVPREALSALIGSDCNLDLVIADIRDELRGRPYDLVAVAGGFQHRTRAGYGDVICSAGTATVTRLNLSRLEQLVLTAIAYFQPVTRMGVADLLGRPISRDAVAALRSAGLIGTGPRSPQPGAPLTYVTTPAFLELTGLPTLRDLPDIDRLEAAGLLGKAPLADELRGALGIRDEAEPEERGTDEANDAFGIFDDERDGVTEAI
jgi:segregation and condensation protein B